MLLKLGEVFKGMQERKRDERGFTLIELLVVVIIIGILAAIAIPVFLNQRENAQQASLVTDARNAASEIQSWGTENGGDYTDLSVEALEDAGYEIQFSDTNEFGDEPAPLADDSNNFSFTVERPGGDLTPVEYNSSAGGIQEPEEE